MYYYLLTSGSLMAKPISFFVSHNVVKVTIESMKQMWPISGPRHVETEVGACNPIDKH